MTFIISLYADLKERDLFHWKNYLLMVPKSRLTLTGTHSYGVEPSIIILQDFLIQLTGFINEYNTLITSNGYDVKYEVGEAIMFVI